MAISHRAFIDLEVALGSRTGRAFRTHWNPIRHSLNDAIKSKDWNKAAQVVDSLNLDHFAIDHAEYARTIGMASLLLGASRVTDIEGSHIAEHPPEEQLNNGLKQWAKTITHNTPVLLRRVLHKKLASLAHNAEQERQVIQKDAAEDIDQIGDDGERLMSVAASLMVSRLSSFGFLSEAQQNGIEKYQISAILDDATCPVCEALDGAIFNVSDGIAQATAIMQADDSDSIASLSPWPSQSSESVDDLEDSDAQDLVDSGLQLPPYHPNCRCITVDVDDEQVQQATAEQAESEAEDDLPNVSEATLAAILGLALGVEIDETHHVVPLVSTTSEDDDEEDDLTHDDGFDENYEDNNEEEDDANLISEEDNEEDDLNPDAGDEESKKKKKKPKKYLW